MGTGKWLKTDRAIVPIELAASIANHARSVGLLSGESGPLATAFLVDKDLVLTTVHAVAWGPTESGWEHMDDWRQRPFTVDFEHIPDGSNVDGESSFLDAAPYPWVDSAAAELHRILADAYGQQDLRLSILAKAGVPSQHLLYDGTPNAMWHQALDVTASMGLMRSLVDVVLRDETVSGFHSRIRDLLPAEPPIEARAIAASTGPGGWGALRLAKPSSRPPLALGGGTPIEAGDGVVIIQHPLGDYKRFVIEPEGVVGVDDAVIRYQAATAPGSGGAPIFDMNMRVIGIHERTERQTGLKEGMRIDRVTAELAEQGLNFVGVPVTD